MAILNLDILGKVRVFLRDIMTVPTPQSTELQLIACNVTGELHQIDSSGVYKSLVSNYDSRSGFEIGIIWDFTVDTEGWTANSGTITWDAGNGGSVIVNDTSTTTSVTIYSDINTLFSIDGNKYTKVIASITRLGGSTFNGTLSYKTPTHSANNASYKKVCKFPAQWAVGDNVFLEWDMTQLDAGGTDWTTSTIQRLSIVLSNTTTGIDDSYRINWIAIGRDVPVLGLPQDGTAGQVIKKTGTSSTSYAWQTPTAYQPIDADLTALSALTGTNTIYYRSAADTWTPVTIGSNLTFSSGTLAATGGSGSPAGSNTQIQFNNAGAFGASADLVFDDTNNRLSLLGTNPSLELLAVTSPLSAPASGKMYFYAEDIAGQVVPSRLSPSGIDTPLQDDFSFNGLAQVTPASGTTLAAAVTAFGTTFTNVGSVANPTPTTTNLASSVRRTTFSTGSASSSIAGHRQNVLMFWRGNAAGLGGFRVVIRFSIDTLVSGNRAFIGISDSISSPTNVDPLTSTTPGKVGIAFNSNTGNLFLVNNVSGTAPTTLDLGANFPNVAGRFLELILYCPPNGSAINYKLNDYSNSLTTSGSLTTNIPANTSFLNPNFWITNNTTSSAAILALYKWTSVSNY